MCGIAGGVTSEDTGSLGEIVERVIALQRHRGPDFEGFRSYANSFFGSSRLAITGANLKSHNQPFFSDLGMMAVFNGEIYNYKQIAVQLGIQAESDGDVILPLYQKYGDSFPSYLDGMFAIAIWDNANKRLLLIRDSFGEKPLYFAQIRNQVFFSSELVPLAKSLDLRNLDRREILNYLRLGFVPAPNSIVSGIGKVRPGHAVKFDLRREFSFESAAFDSFPSSGGHRSAPKKAVAHEHTLVEQLDEIITNSVMSRLPLDSDYVIPYSGGIDSSIIASSVANQECKKPEKMLIFRERDGDHTDLAIQFAKELGFDFSVIDSEKSDFDLQSLVTGMDEVNADVGFQLHRVLAQQSARYAPVLITGDGGDELFGGYPKYSLQDKLIHVNSLKLPGKFANIFDQFIDGSYFSHEKTRCVTEKMVTAIGPLVYAVTSTAEPRNLRFAMQIAYTGVPRFISQKIQEGLFPQNTEQRETESFFWESLSVNGPSEGRFGDYRDLDERVFLSQVLMKVDSSTMAHSVEARAPFLAREVVEFAHGIEFSTLYNRSQTKTLLRELLKHRGFPTIANLPKKGFGLDMGEILSQNSKSDVLEIIASGPLGNLAGSNWLKSLLMQNPIGSVSSRTIWPILILSLWSNKNGFVI